MSVYVCICLITNPKYIAPEVENLVVKSVKDLKLSSGSLKDLTLRYCELTSTLLQHLLNLKTKQKDESTVHSGLQNVALVSKDLQFNLPEGFFELLKKGREKVTIAEQVTIGDVQNEDITGESEETCVAI
eukprot:m.78381 g.78381  ORF g.78381 m.78381 type:complete len:130 (-) comp12667_c0_seq9:63-452(-)